MEIAIRKFKDMLLDSKASVSQQMASDYTHSSSHHTSNTILNQNCYQTHEEFETIMSQHVPVIPSNIYHSLPKLDFPTFSDDILACQIFMYSFQTTVHTDPSLTNV